ncbi:major capsid protein [uncultured Corynebacterium sp.]|uniref:major capsid protein n=1 Tax=uncultured Corynebacterium sp. TaxID=159447 RepID=UPI0026315052|nr:major capsid protein [uncultured Corynebacterium sp.]
MFTLPENLPATTGELTELRAEIVTAFNTLYSDGKDVTAEKLATLQELSNNLETVDTAIADAKTAAEADELAEKFNAETADEATDADTEPANDTNNDTDGDADPEPHDTAEDTTDKDEEKDTAVTASAKTRFANAAGTTNPELPRRNVGFRLTTSAQNYETGVVDVTRVATEFANLAHGHSARVVSGSGGAASTTFAYLDRDMPAEYTIDDANDAGRAEAVMAFAADETNLNGGSLTAAGGWCAPSETIYDFLPTLQATDLLSLPEVTATRGGLKFPKEPSFADIYKNFPGFQQTETQAQANTEKTCVEIPCDEFEELRMDVIGQCITSGILQSKAWPEQTAKYINEVVRAHQHRLSAYKIDKISAGSPAVTVTGVFAGSGALLNGIALQATDIRVKHRIPRTQSIEGFAPAWSIELMRADMAFQQGVEVKDVSDEQILEWFRKRGINLQFVVDWQTDVIGGDKPATAWPTEVKVALYPSGTWISAVEPVINLGINYDHALLKTNKRVELFTEDGVLVGKRGFESRLVTIPVKVDGMVGVRGPAAGAAAG